MDFTAAMNYLIFTLKKFIVAAQKDISLKALICDVLRVSDISDT